MPTTTDRSDPRLMVGVDETPVPQSKAYLILSEEEREKGYVRPFRATYVHDVCGTATTMNGEIAATYARNPFFYGSTYCCECQMHKPVGEFKWDDGEVVGS